MDAILSLVHAFCLLAFSMRRKELNGSSGHFAHI
jgi:hypothetical protein